MLGLNVAIVVAVIGLSSNSWWGLNELLPPFIAGALGFFVMILTRAVLTVDDMGSQRDLLAASDSEEIANGVEQVVSAYHDRLEANYAALRANHLLYYIAAAGELMNWLTGHVMSPYESRLMGYAGQPLPTIILALTVAGQVLVLVTLDSGVRQWSKHNGPHIEARLVASIQWIERIRRPIELVALLPLLLSAALAGGVTMYTVIRIVQLAFSQLCSPAIMAVGLARAMVIPIMGIGLVAFLVALITVVRWLLRKLPAWNVLLLSPPIFVLCLMVLYLVIGVTVPFMPAK
jgi:hypothetical protein